MLRAEFVATVISNTKIINSAIDDDELLEYVAEEVVDRVLLYLNCPDDGISPRLGRVVARIVNGVFIQSVAEKDSATPEMEVSSVSDNGQSISYSGKVKTYLATADDQEIFGGFTKLLAPYRRMDVVL